jgi:hypothetical protein
MKRTTWLGTGLILICFFAIGIVLGRLHIQNQLGVQARAPVATEAPAFFMATPAPTEVAPLPELQPPVTPVAIPQAPVNPNPEPPTEQQLQQGLRAVNWTFTPTNPMQVAGSILTQEQAIEAAQKQFQQQGSRVTAHLGQLQNLGLQQSLQAGQTVDSPFAQPHLVWIVTFSGVQGSSSGPPGHERKLSNELNVVVDARTGAYLMDFVWTR